MDSIADTLWTLFSLAVIIGSLVFGTVRKGKKAAQHAPHKEAWPKIEIKPIIPPTAQGVAPTSKRAAEQHPTAAATRDNPLKKVAKTVQRPSATTTPLKTDIHSSNGAKNSNTPGILEEFDLRKAVIYSEILHPKFKEES